MRVILPVFILFSGLRSFASALVCHSDLTTNYGAIRSDSDLTQPLGPDIAANSASAVLANYRADVVMTHLNTVMPTIMLVVYRDNSQVASLPVPIGVTASRSFNYDDFSVTTTCFVRD